MGRPGNRKKPKGFSPGSNKGATNGNGTLRHPTKKQRSNFAIKKR
jgi:hypothetical protein